MRKKAEQEKSSVPCCSDLGNANETVTLKDDIMPLVIICIEDMEAAVFCVWTVASANIQENMHRQTPQ